MQKRFIAPTLFQGVTWLLALWDQRMSLEGSEKQGRR